MCVGRDIDDPPSGGIGRPLIALLTLTARDSYRRARASES
jgi:hypothetical protein